MISKKTLGMVCKVLNSKLGVGAACSSVNRIKKYGSSQKDSKKGFTLVELIVVLVVIALLAGLAIPLVIGYIDKAHEKQYMVEAKAALTATQSALSDAYTNGMTSLPRSLRNKAKETAEASDDSAFTIWTAKHFSVADGTYRTSACYSIVEALYKTEDDHFVYFDGTEWTVYNEDDEALETIVARTNVTNENLGNIVYVWPCTDAEYAKDSANGTTSVDPESEGIDVADNSYDDTEGGESIPEETELNLTSSIDIDVYLVVPGTNKGLVFNPAATDNKVHVIFSYVSENNNGFKTDVGNSSLTSEEGSTYSIDAEKNYSFDNVFWHLGSLNSETKYKSIADESDSIIEYLKSYGATLDSASESGTIEPVTFYASIDPSKIPINVFFMPYTDKQIVSSDAAEAYTDEDSGRIGIKLQLEYNESTETLEGFPNESSISVSPNPDETSLANLTEEQRNAVVQFNNEWFVADASNNYSAVESSLADYAENWADANHDNSDLVGEDGTGLVFEAPADICKTAYLVTDENSDRMSFNDDQTATVEFAEYELDGTQYELRGSDRIEITDSYSIFMDTDYFDGTGLGMATGAIDLHVEDPNKLKVWQIFSCDAAKNITLDSDNKEIRLDNVREKDCTDSVLDTLYDDTYQNYWELVEVDATEITTRLLIETRYNLNRNANDNPESPVRAKFLSIVGNKADKIKSINYIDNTVESLTENGYVAGSVSQTAISTTTPDNVASVDFLELARTGESAEVSGANLDPDYPGYTIAYSVGDSTNGYDIYVFTQDNTLIKAEGSLRRIHYNFTKMTSNSFLCNLDTSGVTSVYSMLENCYELTSIDLSNFTAESLVSGEGMFSCCRKITSVTVGFGEAPNLVTVRGMFYSCYKLTSINMPNFDTSHATIFTNHFYQCSSLNVAGSNYDIDITNGKEFTHMFYECTALTEAIFTTGGKTSNMAVIPESDEMYVRCGNLKTITLNNAVFSNKDGLRSLYLRNGSLEHAKFINGSKYGDGTSLNKLFEGFVNLKKATFDDSTTQNVTDMSYLFSGCTGLNATSEINGLNMTSATTVSHMFDGCTGLTHTQITGFSTETAAYGLDMSYMFNGCTGLNYAGSTSGALALTGFNIEKAGNIGSMFSGCTSLENVVLSGDGLGASGCQLSKNGVVGVFTDSSVKNITLYNIKFKEFTGKDSETSNTNSALAQLLVSSSGSLEKFTAKTVSFDKLTTLEYLFGDVKNTSVGSANSIYENLKKVEFNDVTLPKLGRVKGMFQGCRALESVRFVDSGNSNNWVGSFMFRFCTNITSIEFENSDASKTPYKFASLNYTFMDCFSLTDIDLSCINTSNTTSFEGMFSGCYSLKILDLSGIDTTKVTNYSKMFATDDSYNDSKNSSLETILVSENFKNVNASAVVFGNGLIKLEGGKGTTLEKINASDSANKLKGKYAWIDGYEGKDGYFTLKGKTYAQFTTMSNNWTSTLGFNRNIETIGEFRRYTDSITEEQVLAKSGVKDISDSSFIDPVSGEHVKIYGWFEGNVFYWWSEAKIAYLNPNTTGMFNMYYGNSTKTSVLTLVDFQGIDTSKVKSFERFFSDNKELTQIIDGSTGADYKFNTDSATSMFSMFGTCLKLTSLDMTGCDTSKVTTMYRTFFECTSLQTLDLSSFSSEALTNCEGMFDIRSEKPYKNDSKLQSITFGPNFNCRKVINMKSMFHNCKKLVTLDLSGFDSSKTEITNALDVTYMFQGCSELTTIYVSDPSETGHGFSYSVDGFDSRMSNSADTFYYCDKLVGGGSSGYNVNYRRAQYGVIGTDSRFGYFTKKD